MMGNAREKGDVKYIRVVLVLLYYRRYMCGKTMSLAQHPPLSSDLLLLYIPFQKFSPFGVIVCVWLSSFHNISSRAKFIHLNFASHAHVLSTTHSQHLPHRFFFFSFIFTLIYVLQSIKFSFKQIKIYPYLQFKCTIEI